MPASLDQTGNSRYLQPSLLSARCCRSWSPRPKGRNKLERAVASGGPERLVDSGTWSFEPCVRTANLSLLLRPDAKPSHKVPAADGVDSVTEEPQLCGGMRKHRRRAPPHHAPRRSYPAGSGWTLPRR